jgi:hypothetical protein
MGQNASMSGHTASRNAPVESKVSIGRSNLLPGVSSFSCRPLRRLASGQSLSTVLRCHDYAAIFVT